MIKPTPNPPKTDPVENLDSENHHEAPDRIPSAADIRAPPRTPCSMYVIDPHIDAQTLLDDACVSLASAHVMTMDLAELSVNRALDQIDRTT